MRKALFITGICLGIVSASIAQIDTNYSYVRPVSHQVTAISNSMFTLGLGFGGYYPYAGPMYAENANLIFGFDHTIIKHVGAGNISLGAVLAYKDIASYYSSTQSDFTYTQRWNYYLLGTRVEYNWQPSFLSRNFSAYVGGMAAYYITGFKFSSTDPNSNESGDPGYYLAPNIYPNFVALSAFAGMRSYINTHLSGWLELGYGYNSLSFGLCYKI